LKYIEHPDDIDSSVDPLADDAEVRNFQLRLAFAK
jgi:hypothetical protein